MTIAEWKIDISKMEGPCYLALANEIARAIDSGELAPGAQLPTHRQLADRLGITVGTVSRAYALARKRRLIVGEVGRGTFVQGRTLAERNSSYIPHQANQGLDLSTSGSPLFEGLNQQLSQSLAQVCDRVLTLPLHKYPPDSGILSHRLAGVTWIARSGLEVSAEQVLITNGAQEALAVCLTVLAKHGDTILTEDLTYSGLKSLATIYGLRLQGVAMDEYGIVPDALENAAKQHGARVVYLQPTIHNPTAVAIPEARRRQIADVAKRCNLTVIEDDVSAACLTQRPMPIFALIPDQCIYVTSLSKSMSPTLRIGYLAASAPLLNNLVDAFRTLTLGVSPINAEIATTLISSGGASDIARTYLNAMGDSLDIARQTLPEGVVQGQPGACFFWLKLPGHWNVDNFVRAAKQLGIVLPYADSFLADDTGGCQGVRVSLNPALQPDTFRRALLQLEELMSGHQQLRPVVI